MEEDEEEAEAEPEDDSDDSIDFFGKPVEIPPEIMEDDEYKLQTELNEHIENSDG